MRIEESWRKSVTLFLYITTRKIRLMFFNIKMRIVYLRDLVNCGIITTVEL